jgi:DNA-binding PadR family transcriptional regulator
MASATATPSSARLGNAPGERLELGLGSLYGAIKKLTSDGLIEESEHRPEAYLDDERRRYYRLTADGRAVVKAESARLRALIELDSLLHSCGAHDRAAVLRTGIPIGAGGQSLAPEGWRSWFLW